MNSITPSYRQPSVTIDPRALRATADSLQAEKSAAALNSEYPRMERYVRDRQSESLRELADAAEVPIPPKRSGMTGEERRERAAALLRLRAAKARVASAERERAGHNATKGIPFGQPIMDGHHSEGGHRRAVERGRNASAAAFALSNKAEALDRRAGAVENAGAIMAGDSDAIDQLSAKVTELTAQSDKMKATNLAWRAYKRTGKLDKLSALGWTEKQVHDMSERLLDRAYWKKQPHQPFELSNLGATIRTAQKRLASLKAATANGPKEIELRGGVRILSRPDIARTQIIFPDKPTEACRTSLKHSGFRWSPTEGAWQRNQSAWAEQLAKEIVAEFYK